MDDAHRPAGQYVEREIGALLAALEERLSEEAEPARPIHLEEVLTGFGVSKDQEGVAWLTCNGLPVLNLDATFRRIVSTDGRVDLPGGTVVQLCDGCEKNKAGCVSVGEEVLCGDCLLARAAEAAPAIQRLWEAATDLWHDPDRKLEERLFDSSVALNGMPIKGKDLHQIGEALGFIPEGEE